MQDEGVATRDWLGELRQRRVFPLIAAYFGVMWALLEFTGFVVARYSIADRWIDAVFLSMWLLLPLALMLAWRIGAPGRVRWLRRDLLVMLGLLAAATGGVSWQQLRMPAKPVAVTRVAESKATAPAPVVASSRRVTALAIFPFAVDSADPADAWLSDALPVLTEIDLQYDRRFTARTPISDGASGLQSIVQRLGATDALSAPLALRRRAVVVQGMQALVAGRVKRLDRGYEVTLEIHRVMPDAALGPFRIEGAEVWSLVDQIAARLRQELAPPEAQVAANDPALRAISSESIEALQAFVTATRAGSLDLDVAAAERGFARAAELDPAFVRAAYHRGAMLGALGQRDASLAVLEQLLPLLDTLPPSLRYAIQASRSYSTGDQAGARRAYEAWATALPEDRQPRYALASMDLQKDPDDLAALQRMHELALASGSNGEILSVAGYYQQREDLATARALVETARQRDPSDPNVFMTMMRIEQSAGNLDAALAAVDQMAVARPDLVQPEIDRAQLQFNRGDWQAGLQTLDRVARRKLAPIQQALVLEMRISLMATLGRYRPTLPLIAELGKVHAGVLQPLELLRRHHIGQLQNLARAGDEASARESLEPALTSLDPLMRAYFEAMAEFQLAEIDTNGTRLLAAIAKLETAAAAFGTPFEEHVLGVYKVRAQLEIDGLQAGWPAYKAALAKAVQNAGKLRAHSTDLSSLLKRSIPLALAAGDSKLAVTWLERLQKSEPGDPEVRLLEAQVAVAQGDRETARVAVELALAAWAEADPGFEPVATARALKAQL